MAGGLSCFTISSESAGEPLPVITLNQSQLLSGIDSNPSQPKSGNDIGLVCNIADIYIFIRITKEISYGLGRDCYLIVLVYLEHQRHSATPVKHPEYIVHTFGLFYRQTCLTSQIKDTVYV